jgi:diguanylate cyclase (GGDEF)-like protein/PAS domain S-box-containing protein
MSGPTDHTSDRLCRELLDSLFVLVTIFSKNGIVLEMNEAALEALGLARDDVVGLSFSDLAGRVFEPVGLASARAMLQSAKQGQVVRTELVARLKGGRKANLACVFKSLRDADGEVTQIVASGMEVTAYREAKADLVKANRELRLVSACNRLLFRASDEQALLSGICRLMVEEGGYRGAWIGYAQADPGKSVLLQAVAGVDADHFRRARISWADTPAGNGPIGRAIRARTVEICRDIKLDPLFTPWYEEARLRGYHSSIALPLFTDGNCLGTLNVYSDRPTCFDAGEVSWLRELSWDLAYCVDALRTRAEHHNAEQQVGLVRTLLQHTNDMIYVVDAQTGRVLDTNNAGCQRLGYTREEVLELKVADFSVGAADQTWAERVAHVKAMGTLVMEGRYKTKNGTTIPVEFSLRYLEHDSRQYIIGVTRDIAERRRHGEQIERLTRILRMQSGVNSAVLRIEDRGELLQEACRLATEVGGYDRAVFSVVEQDGKRAIPRFRAGSGMDLAEAPWIEIGDGTEPDRSLSGRALRTGQIVVSRDLRQAEPPVMRRENLITLGYRAMVALPLVVEGRPAGVLLLFSRDTDLVADDELLLLLQDMLASLSFALRSKQYADTAQFLAYYDSLTGLAKRSVFSERLDALLRRGQGPESPRAVVAFDVRSLNSINDTFGRHFGDLALQAIAERLKRYSTSDEHVGYFGGGTFALLEPPLSTGDDSIRSVLDSNLFGEPFEIEGRTMRLSCSYGVAHYPEDGLDSGTLVQRAEAAIKQAKEAGERYLHYKLDMQSGIAERMELEHRLSTAIEQQQFELYYQAQLDLATGNVIALEALLRWNDPVTGVVPPSGFIDVLESSGMIVSVGDWVIARAVADCERWAGMGLRPVRVAVNVSAVQLRQRSFVRNVLAVSARLQRCAGFGLDLEITETTLLQDLEGTSRKLRELRSHGIRIALDDFGTGYSSLGLLSKLPVDLLKIDRSFVQGLPDDPASVALVESIIRLASAFELIAVVEGVETTEQLDALRSMHCNHWQGFLYGPPVPVSQIELILPRL